MAKRKQWIVKADKLFTGTVWKSNQTVVLEGDQIVDVCKSSLKTDFSGVVTPAFIDPHSHIGMIRAGEPSSEQEVNDQSEQIHPSADPLNSVYFDDTTFREAVDFGVLYSCIIPGSGNLFGGRARIIRNFAQNRQTSLFADYGFKMALGFNPRSTTAWKGNRPNTRMGIYSMLENCFEEVLRKQALAVLKYERAVRELEHKSLEEQVAFKTVHKQELDLALTRDEKAILEVVNGEKTVKVHVHKEDDVIYLLELVAKYGLKVTAEHCCDVHTPGIFGELGKQGIPIVYGPLGTFAYKTELKHDAYDNVKHLIKSGSFFGLMTDHPVVHAGSLRDSLKYFLVQGLSEVEALQIITLNNAKILGIEDRLGTIEPGKLASVLVWDRDPLHLAAMPRVVFGEGTLLRKG